MQALGLKPCIRARVRHPLTDPVTCSDVNQRRALLRDKGYWQELAAMVPVRPLLSALPPSSLQYATCF